MNLPNKLTLLRIILVIPFLAFLITAIALEPNAQAITLANNQVKASLYLSSGIVFVLAMLTDFADGFLARKNNEVTTFGQLFDPLADKFITTSALVFLAVEGIVPFYLVLGFVLRDILVDGSRNVAAKNNVKVAASWFGKWKTMLLSIGITIIFMVIPFVEWAQNLVNPSWEIWLLISPILIALVLSSISGVQYFKAIIPYLKIN